MSETNETWGIGILGTGSYLPPGVRENGELAEHFGVTPDWIVERTGVRERRVARPDEATSDLATEAARRALDDAGVRAEDLDLIVVATSTPDWIQPATACVVQANLGASRAAAFDLSAVCTGFVYGVSVAAAFLRGAPQYRTALVIGADTYSRVLDPDDRATTVLFGDGAGAAVLGTVPDGYGVLTAYLGADGRKADLVGIPAGGTRRPIDDEALRQREHCFHMNGRGVRQFVWERVPASVVSALEEACLDPDDVALIVPHQANGVLVRECLGSLGFDDSRVHFTVDRYGNTGAASVAVTLDDAARSGRLRDGDHVVLLGFGGGMTWGSVVLRWRAK